MDMGKTKIWTNKKSSNFIRYLTFLKKALDLTYNKRILEIIIMVEVLNI